jgi:hypothetical protein
MRILVAATLRYGAILLSTLCGTASGHAQFIDSNTIVNNAISQTRFNLFMANSRFNIIMATGLASSVRRAELAGKRLPRNGSATATLFVPSADAIAPQKLAIQYGGTAKARLELTQLAHELLQAYKSSLKRTGVPENELAHVLAYSLRIGYLIHSDGRGELTKEQSDGLVQIVRAFIVDHPPFKTMSDRDKQESYETLAILGTYAITSYEAAKRRNDTGLMANLHVMARNHIVGILGPMETIVLTKDGFMYK